MRRTILLGLLAALLLAPVAYADATTTKIIRDCADDGVLEGHYTPSELRKARDNLPTDVDEYSDCGDVLSRALSAGTSSDGGGSPSGGSSGGGAPAPTSTPTPTPTPQYSDSVAQGLRVASPSTAQDKHELADAGAHGGQGDTIAGRPLAPAADIGGHFGRNSLPATLIVVLALLAGTAFSFVVPTIRRRVRARKAP